MPKTNFFGADRFTYTVSDGRGGIATGTVVVDVRSETSSTFNRITSITVVTNGVKLRFEGIPGYTYTVERSPAVTGPWTAVGTFTVGDDAIAEFLDTHPPTGMAFYRALLP